MCSAAPGEPQKLWCPRCHGDTATTHAPLGTVHAGSAIRPRSRKTSRENKSVENQRTSDTNAGQRLPPGDEKALREGHPEASQCPPQDITSLAGHSLHMYFIIKHLEYFRSTTHFRYFNLQALPGVSHDAGDRPLRSTFPRCAGQPCSGCQCDLAGFDTLQPSPTAAPAAL